MDYIKDLELGSVLGFVAEFASSKPGKYGVLSEVPRLSIADANKELDTVAELGLLVGSGLSIPSFDYADESLAKAKIGGVLTPIELYNVFVICHGIRQLVRSIQANEDIVILREWLTSIVLPQDVETALGGAVGSGGEILDSASDTLRTIRRKIIVAKNKLNDKLASYMRGGELSKYLQDNIVTVRGGRYVVPVKAEYKSSVAGLVHDKSHGGSTVYIEPMACVELNNELRALEGDMDAEVERILRELSGIVADNTAEILSGMEYLVRADIAKAKYSYAKSVDAVRPKLSDKNIIHLIGARHPLICADIVVPIDISLGLDKSIMLLSGPNTGGKTVTLKTVGLLSLMAACGIYVPSKEAELPVFGKVWCDIGDGQNIGEGLSTFSSRIVRIKQITDNMDDGSLLLLDELGSGTDPNEGAALAIGVIESIKAKGAMALITTHFGELKRYAATDSKIMGASMRFDDVTEMPTYQLISNLPGVSNAIRTAGRLGLDKRIIDTAYKYILPGQLKFEKALREANRLKVEALEEKEAAAKERIEATKNKEQVEQLRVQLQKQRDSIAKSANNRVDKLVESSRNKADDIIARLRECLNRGDEKAYFEARKIAAELDDIAGDTDSVVPKVEHGYNILSKEDITVGRRVFVVPAGLEGVIKDIDGKGGIRVSVGSMVLGVKPKDLAQLPESGKPKNKPMIATKDKEVQEGKSAPTAKEINIIGLSVSEGVAAVEIFLDECRRESVDIVRIIHGKGTGILGKGIQTTLAALHYVKSYRYGDLSEGGKGATVAEL